MFRERMRKRGAEKNSKKLIFIVYCVKIPSLTVEKQENGYKSSKYGKYSRFSFCIDMCFWLFNIFVFLIIVRMELLVMIS